jgi:glycerophosphoryl diester phosphodiesterase
VPTSLETRIWAHRGSSSRYPENTLEAFRQALEEGANALETDVHRTSDGHFVVCHDAHGRRTALTAQAIRGTTLDVVRTWDVGAGFVAASGDRPHAGAGHVVPTLDELIAAFPETPLSIDLKPNSPRDVPALLDLLTRHGVHTRVTLASFHPRIVRRIRRLAYPGPTALTQFEVALIYLLPPRLARRFVQGTSAAVPLSFAGLRLDSARFMARCRRLGLRSDYWVVNDPAVAVGLLARGATGVMTDDPARVAPAVRRVQVASPGSPQP